MAENEAVLSARLQRAAESCARQGVRLTELRAAVLRLILQAHEPVGAYALLDRLRESHGNAKPPTVYRALDFLLAQGLIHRVERLNAFVGCMEEGAHAHPAQFLICGECGQVRELEDEVVEASIGSAARAAGFTPRRVTVEIEGVCARCTV